MELEGGVCEMRPNLLRWIAIRVPSQSAFSSGVFKLKIILFAGDDELAIISPTRAGDSEVMLEVSVARVFKSVEEPERRWAGAWSKAEMLTALPCLGNERVEKGGRSERWGCESIWWG